MTIIIEIFSNILTAFNKLFDSPAPHTNVIYNFGQNADIVSIILTAATVMVGAAALLVAWHQRKDSIRSYRISLLSMLLEQLSKENSREKTKDHKEEWSDTINSVLMKWAPKEAKEIQAEIEKRFSKSRP